VAALAENIWDEKHKREKASGVERDFMVVE